MWQYVQIAVVFVGAVLLARIVDELIIRRRKRREEENDKKE